MDYVLGLLRRLAERDEPVDPSVFRLRAVPRPASLPRHLTEAESQRLETSLHQRLTSADPLSQLESACGFLLLHRGLRRGECVDLRYSDLDLPGQRLIVRQGKGQKGPSGLSLARHLPGPAPLLTGAHLPTYRALMAPA